MISRGHAAFARIVDKPLMEALSVSLDLKYFLSLNIKAFVPVDYITLAYSI